MLVEGNKIAATLIEKIKSEVNKLPRSPRMTIVTCAPNFETRKYLKMKKAKASEVNIDLNIVELSEFSTTMEMTLCINQVARVSDGVVVQLPLPEQIDVDTVIGTIAPSKDPDGFQYGKVEGVCMSPVVAAIDEISRQHKVEWKDKKVAVLGKGRLVGAPACYYAEQKGAQVVNLLKENFSLEAIKEADIIVSGIGQPNFIKPEMVADDVIIFDAGTSEEGGELVGDVDRKVASKASLVTPVPGGIGPVTVACLMRNLLELSRHK